MSDKRKATSMKTLDVTDPKRKKPKAGEQEVMRSAVVKPDYSGTMKNFGGSRSNDWNKVLIDQAFASLWCGNSDEETKGRQINATVAFMAETKPGDELEAMMAAQMFAAHNAAMECYRRAMIRDQPMQARGDNLSQANKLSRTFATMIEALARHRGKSTQQKVTVKHVHIHEGGQAAFGQFNPPQAGGGVQLKDEDQPHGCEPTAIEPPMLRQDPLGNVLPIPGHAERSMSHARRREPRRTKG